MTDTDQRKEALDDFAAFTGLDGLNRLVQRGRDPLTARFTAELDDGREIRIGTIESLMSRAKLNRVLAVALGKLIKPCKPAEWEDALANLIQYGVDVEETPGEAFDDTVREWAVSYLRNATTDKEGAAATSSPFRENGSVFIGANGLAKYVRREYSETVKLHELRQALSDIGFERETIYYSRGRGDQKVRSSTSYYRCASETLEPQDEA